MGKHKILAIATDKDPKADHFLNKLPPDTSNISVMNNYIRGYAFDVSSGTVISNDNYKLATKDKLGGYRTLDFTPKEVE